MHDKIKESDWKIYKKLRPLALQRYCQRVLDDIDNIIHKDEEDAHERYLEVYKTIQHKDKNMSHLFDRFSRSKARIHLALYCDFDLLTEEETAPLSDETKKRIQSIIEFRNE